MKKLLTLLFAGCSFAATAQENPFEEFGYKPKLATLSGGKFIEYFDRDTIVQIGTLVYNTKSKKVVGFVEEDTANSEATLQPDIVSRWISPDPLAYAAPGWTPYRFAYDNPIYWTDPTGLLEGDYYGKDGTWLGNDGIDDGKVYVVDGASKFNQSDFQEGGKYFQNQSEFNENYGDGHSVTQVGMDSDLGKMIRTVYAEAAGQGAESKLAVAEVIRNRALDNTSPSAANKYTAQFSNVSTYGEVVEQKGQFESVQSGAARYTNPLSVTSGNTLEQRAFVQSAGASIKAHYQNTNTAGGALFFYSPYIQAPNWTTVLEQVEVSGVNNNDFRFYKYK